MECSSPEIQTISICDKDQIHHWKWIQLRCRPFCFQPVYYLHTLLASALMTIPRLDKEPLMAVISLKRSPWDWLLSIRSLPAKSTRHRVAVSINTQNYSYKIRSISRFNTEKSDYYHISDTGFICGLHTHTCIWHPCQHSLPRYPAGRLNGSERSGHSGPSGLWSDSDWPTQSGREPGRRKDQWYWAFTGKQQN